MEQADLAVMLGGVVGYFIGSSRLHAFKRRERDILGAYDWYHRNVAGMKQP